MKRIEGPFAVGSRFVQGSLEQTKTPMTAHWLNSVQEEIAHTIESSGIRLNKQDTHQLSKALERKVSGFYQSHEIHARLPDLISLEEFDLTAIYNTHCFKKVVELINAGQDQFSAQRLDGFRLDPVEVIGAQFFIKITRTTGPGQRYTDFLPYSAQFTRGPCTPFHAPFEFLDKRIRYPNLAPYSDRVRRLLQKDLSLARSWHLSQDTSFNVYSYLTVTQNTANARPVKGRMGLYVRDDFDSQTFEQPINLMIARDGQFYLIGDHVENHDANYTGRIDIVDMKKIPPYPQ